MMKRVLIIAFLLMVICGCSNSNNIKSNSNVKTYESIIEENNYIVIDVRTEDEYNEGHVVGALNIEYDKIDEKVDLDKSKTILVYCQSGRRSEIAYNTLKDLGYEVFDLGAYESVELDKE